MGCLSGSSKLDWGSVDLLWTYKVHFSDSECALHPGLCLGWALWVFHAMSFSGSLSRGGGGVSFAFVTGFVAKTQAPPLLLGLRASLCRPNQRETIAMGDCYILCGRSGVTWAARRRRCERFLFAAECSMKELSKTTVSFWLLMLLSRVCWLSVTEWSVLCPLSSVHSCCRFLSSLRRTLLSSWWGGAWLWLSRSSFRGYFGAGAPQFLAAFHQFCVVAVPTLVLPGPACLDISLLTTWRLVLGPCFLVHSPTIRRLPMGCHGWWFGYVSTF